MQYEYKSLSFELKEESKTEDGWIVEGYGSTYDLDSGYDKIMPGAFKKTIEERFTKSKLKNGKSKVKCLWQHDSHDIIGSVLELREDENGLYCKMKLFDNASIYPNAAKAYDLLKRGEIDSFSIGYRPVDTDWLETDELDCRIINELKLYEISIVTFPMNEKAEVTAVKNDLREKTKEMNEKAIALLEDIKNLLVKLNEVKETVVAESVLGVEEVKEVEETPVTPVVEPEVTKSDLEQFVTLEQVKSLLNDHFEEIKSLFSEKKEDIVELNDNKEEDSNSIKDLEEFFSKALN